MKRRKFVQSVFQGSVAASMLPTYSLAGKLKERRRMNSKVYDVIVIGVGSMGSAACYYLSKAGASVLGLEQYDISHEQGSHAGQSRIIRKAYFEHPDYVPLLERAYSNWKTIEEESGSQLYHPTGLLYIGRSEEPLLQGVRKSADIYGVELNDLNAEQSKAKFPQFHLSDGFESIFEPEAGFVTPEKTILSLANMAINNGADIITRSKVKSWEKKGEHYQVSTEKNTFTARKIIICSGAYTSQIVPSMESSLKVTQQLITWSKPMNWDDFTLGNFPCWVMTQDGIPGMFYGFPILPVDEFMGPIGVKIAYHHGGKAIQPENSMEFDEKDEVEKLKQFTADFVPGAMESVLSVKSCLYTYSPDDHFIIDYLPDHDKNVAIASGFSGHGFKFVPVVGEILSDMILEGKTEMPIEFLRIDRF